MNILLLVLGLIFQKLKTVTYKTQNTSIFLYSIRFSYEEFNDYDKLKFKDNFIYFLS
jgi:hypothetical protein